MPRCRQRRAEPQSADGRERWWRPASDGVRIHDEDIRDAPEKAAAHTAASRLFAEQRTDMYRRWLDERAHWGPEWNRAAESSESSLRITADELAELNKELMLGGGVIADRLGPRRVLISSDAVRSAAVLAVAVLLLVGRPGCGRWPRWRWASGPSTP